MRCEAVLPLLWELADDENALEPRARREVEAHVSSCALCAGRKASILATHGVLTRGIPAARAEAETPPFVVPVRADAAPFRNRVPLALAALGLAALAVVALRLLPLLPEASLLGRVTALPEVVLSAGLPAMPDLGAASRVAEAVEPIAARARIAFESTALPARLRGVSATAVAGLLLLQLAGSARLLSPRRREVA